jgi:hypothetical protein
MRIRRRMVWCLGFALLILATVPRAEAAATVVMGTITDTTRHAPCAGAFVGAYPNSYLPYATYADAQGAYVLTMPVVDLGVDHYFFVTKTGFVSIIEVNPPGFLDAQVNTHNAGIWAGALISGHVRAAAGGAPIAGATVKAASDQSTAEIPYADSTVTAADGSYQLRQPPGTSSLTVEHPLWAPPPTLTLSLVDTVDVSNEDFSLFSGGTLGGRVTYAGTTNPAAGVLVMSIFGSTADYLPQSITYTAADGTYQIPHVYPGLTHVQAVGPPGYANALRYNFQVVDLQTLAGIDFQLQRGGSVSGFVHDYLDRPVSQAAVTIFPATGNSNQQFLATTGSTGTFLFSGLALGQYSLAVVPPQGRNLQSVEFSGIGIQGSVTLTVRNVILQPGGIVRGTVYDLNQQPLANANVQLFQDMKYPFAKLAHVKTDAAGAYQLDGLSPYQNYDVEVTPQSSLSMYNTASLAKGVVVAENTVHAQDFHLGLGGGMRGTVTAAGNSLSGGSVILLNSEHAVSAELATDGTYTLSYAPPGDYLCVVQDVPVHVQTVTDYLHVTAGALATYDRALTLGAGIDGYVHDAAGNSLAGVKVMAKAKLDVLASLTFFDQAAYTDDTGHYHLSGMAPGTYQLQAVPPVLAAGGPACRSIPNVTVQAQGSYHYNFTLPDGAEVFGSMHDTAGNRTFTGIVKYWSDADPANVGEALADTWGNYALMLPPGTYRAQAYFTSLLGVNLAVEPQASIEVLPAPQTLQQEYVMQTGGIFLGMVTDPLGHPLNLCLVEAYQDDNPLPARIALTDAQGTFRLLGLHSGTFKVQAQAPGYGTTVITAQARLGNTTEHVDLVLVRQTSIAGAVISASGLPLGQAVVQAWDAAGTLVCQAATDVNGAYALAPLSGGPYQVKAAATGMKSAAQSGHYAGDRADFTLAPLIGHDEAVSYPNPCRGRTITFLFWLDNEATALVRVYNQAGELVWDQERSFSGGYQKQIWAVDGVAPGVYLFRVTARTRDGSVKSFPTGKLTIIK